MMTLSTRQIAELEDAYRDGATRKAGAERAGCYYGTACRYFDRFLDLRVPRGRQQQREARYAWRTRLDPPRPVYTGPEWIGKPV